MTNRSIFLSSVVFLLVIVASCKTPYPGYERRGQTPQFKEKLLFTDKPLAKKLLIANHACFRENDGRLTVKCAFENRKKYGIWADVKVVFYDKAEFEVDKSNWQPHYFAPLTVDEVSVSSLNDLADDYCILIREGREDMNVIEK